MDCKTHAGIDLHIHSNASDGSLPPSDIIERAHALNLKAIAITDHDTIDGVKKVLSTGSRLPLDFIPGVEISASPPSSLSITGSFHILGYGIRVDDPALKDALIRLQAARRDRNPRIIERLNETGFHLSMAELHEAFGKSQLGRPHIAQLMVRKGYVKTINAAFDEYIGKGGPAYVNKYRMDCAEAIRLIQDAGGTAVLAHPFLLQTPREVGIEKVLSAVKQMGLEGLEAYYPDHSPEHTARYIELADKYKLLVTGGTDFHGDINPDIEMGIGRGDFHVPESLYKPLVQSFSASAPGV